MGNCFHHKAVSDQQTSTNDLHTDGTTGGLDNLALDQRTNGSKCLEKHDRMEHGRDGSSTCLVNELHDDDDKLTVMYICKPHSGGDLHLQEGVDCFNYQISKKWFYLSLHYDIMNTKTIANFVSRLPNVLVLNRELNDRE